MNQILKMPVPVIGGELNFQPFHDYLLIEPLHQAVTDGGIAVPEGVNRDDLSKGRVVRKGPGRVTEYGTTLPTDFFEVGDVVYLPPPDRAIGIELGRKRYLLTRARELVGKVETKAAVALAIAA